MKNLWTKRLIIIYLVIYSMTASAQQLLPLYQGTIPNSKPAPNTELTAKDSEGRMIISKISIPTLTVFLPSADKANGTAVIICPGGGYWVNAYKHEGTDVALELNKQGIAAFVLKYRLPDESYMVNTAIGPLQDAQQAMLMVRSRAKEWHIDINKVGILGFSAGGHLAATLGTHYTNVLVPNPLNLSVKPNFMILGYPVISGLPAFGDKGSVQKLLGKDASPELVKSYSNETQVTAETPPTFIVEASDDATTVNHSLAFCKALVDKKVPVEIHMYQHGGHGFGLINKTTKEKWMDHCLNWMDANGWIKKTN